jgi:hypothetical protein
MFEEIKERVAQGAIRFRVAVQLAANGDTIDDATVRWPEERPQLAFGEPVCRKSLRITPASSNTLSLIRSPEWTVSKRLPILSSSHEPMSI